MCINILDFTLFPELTRLHSCFMLHEIRNKEYVLTGDLAIHFIELSKTEGSNHRLAQWRHFIALDTPQEEEMTILLKDDPLMHKAYTEYKKFTQDDELRELALSREKYQRDMASRLGAATREGLAKGMQEGKLEGKLEIARGMKQKGLEPGFIAEVTGLPLEEIGKL